VLELRSDPAMAPNFRARRHFDWTMLGRTILLVMWATWPGLARGDEFGNACDGTNLKDGKFLACVGAMVGRISGETAREAVLMKPVREYLQQLAGAPDGYGGNDSDLNALRQLSGRLKEQGPLANRDAISLLDNAIASYAGELRSAVSVKAIARELLSQGVTPDTNIYRQVVEQKYKFLSEDRVRFYSRGPFEMIVRSLRANALESTYFLQLAKNGTPDKSVLDDEIRVLDDLQASVERNPKEQYLVIARRDSEVNTNRFWRASIFFALGKKLELKQSLRELISRYGQFDLQTPDPGHVYIYRAFAQPYTILLRKDGDIDITGAPILNRFYNPAQLALFACGYLEEAGIGGIAKFAEAISSLELSDYYVIAANAEKPEALKDLQTAINRAPEDRSDAADLIRRVKAEELKGFSDRIQQGARSCEIEDTMRDQIYKPFDRLDAQITRLSGVEKYPYQLILGGRLNSNQANMVVEFFNSVLFKTSRPPSPAQGVEGGIAYVARMKMNQ
jgi:hypothetical protein